MVNPRLSPSAGEGRAGRAARAAAGPFGLLAALLLAWQGGCSLFAVPQYLLPSPIAVAKALAADGGPLLAAAAATLTMSLLALGAAALFAWPLALAGALWPGFGRAVRPLAVALQVTPVVAVAPLVTIWAGLDHAGRAIVGLAAVVAFFPLYSGAAAGLASADGDLHRLFDLYGAGRWRRLTRLQLPSAAPFVLEGVKVGVGLAVIGAVVAEFVAGSGQAQGLAWRVLEAEHQLKTADMFAALLVLAVLAAGLHALADRLERRLLRRWRPGGGPRAAG